MNKTTFGISQIFCPTPQNIKTARNWIFRCTAIIAIALKIFSLIPPDISAIVNTWVLQINAFVFYYFTLLWD
jgi:hypothetical protein